MAKFKDRIKLLREESGLSQNMLGQQIGISKSSINMYERGEREPNLDMLEAIADYFNVDLDYLMGKTNYRSKTAWLANLSIPEISVSNIYPIQTRKIPLLGNIACGQPIIADENKELYVEVGADIKADFCLKAKGDSMIGARIQDGDIVFIKKQETVEKGEIAAVLIEDEATLKRVDYDRDNNIIRLFAENTSYKTMIYTGDELKHIRILGKAIAFQSDIR